MLQSWIASETVEPWFVSTPAQLRDMSEMIEGLPISDLAEDITERVAADVAALDIVLERRLGNDWDAVVCATSALCHLERRLLRTARILGIPSFAYCDMWWAYSDRFQSGSELCLPNHLWVIDERMRQEATASLPGNVQVRVVGSPFFEDIARRRAVGSRNGGSTEVPVRFISEPASTKFPTSGVNEFKLAELLLRSMRREGVNNPLVIRPHPLDPIEAWRRWIWRNRNQGVFLDTDPHDVCILNTYVAVGISSMLLTEMSICGIPCASLQLPGADPNYFCLPMEELGICRLRNDAEITTWLQAPPVPTEDLTHAHEGAVNRVTADLLLWAGRKS
jgi:hypothetical protein